MNKKHFLFVVVVAMFATMFSVRANALDPALNPPIGALLIHLQVRYDDPLVEQENPHRDPVEAPEVYIEDHTLTFDSSCHNCTLRLVNADNEVEYTTVITSSTLVLPSTLEGTYELQIIQGEWCFYGDIEL